MKSRSLVALFGLAWGLSCNPAAGPRTAAGKVSGDVYAALASSSRVRVIIALREPSAGVAEMDARVREVGDTQRGVLSQLAAEDFRLTHQWDALSAVAGDVAASGLPKLEAHPDVVRVYRDPVLHASLAESVPLIRANEAHDLGVTGKGVVVAVIDTGIDEGHPDLADAIVDVQCFCVNVDGSGCCPNGTIQQSGAGAAQDDNGHGTNVAGIINSAGRVAPVGVAPDTGIVAIKVLSRQGSGAGSGILSGINYVLKSRPEVRVMNLSLGGSLFSSNCDAADPAVASAFKALKARGTAIFVAAGNEASSSLIGHPACLSGAIPVGAVYDDNGINGAFQVCTDSSVEANQVTCFSNSNPLVAVLAPGSEIDSDAPGGGRAAESGTSQATPHAAGTAALLLQVNPGLSPDRIVSAMQSTGIPITDRRNGLTFRRIDARAALDAVR